jgi:queuine tRNA-ribosyltransferase
LKARFNTRERTVKDVPFSHVTVFEVYMAASVQNRFQITATDGPARSGRLDLMRGQVRTPAFMPVGTQASVKSLDPADLDRIGTDIILANTYHLMLRPGADLVESMGGVSRFMSWNRPVLTDSGGFQVFSLAQRRELGEEGVRFRSHIDGSVHKLSPERAIQLQRQFDSDIVMALDVCVGFDTDANGQREAMELTHRWLPRNVEAFDSQTNRQSATRPLLFGIAQGGFNAEHRAFSAAVVASSAVDGCAIGGLSVGEPKDVMADMLASSISGLPADRPRYLMGVGSPEDLWNAVSAGVDMFDCVLPTRVARRGALFTPDGRINVTNSMYATHEIPVDAMCDCYMCSTFSTSYIHHLFRSKELLGFRLASIHNLRFLMRQMEVMRAAISFGTFESQRKDFLERYQPSDQIVARQQRELYRRRPR